MRGVRFDAGLVDEDALGLEGSRAVGDWSRELLRRWRVLDSDNGGSWDPDGEADDSSLAEFAKEVKGESWLNRC